MYEAFSPYEKHVKMCAPPIIKFYYIYSNYENLFFYCSYTYYNLIGFFYNLIF